MYGCQIWGQNQIKIGEAIERTQNKALRILKFNFKGPRELADNFYKESKTDKQKSIIIKANSRFVYDQLKTNLPENFSNFFTLNTQLQKHNTGKNRLILPNLKAISYGSNSFILKAINQWNEI